MVQKKVHNSSVALLQDELTIARNRAKFEVYGEEMIEKEVRPRRNTGRVYLPPDWVGKLVKIIRID